MFFFTSLGNVHKWNHVVYILILLFNFMFVRFICVTACWNTSLGFASVHCGNILRFIYPSFRWWTLRWYEQTVVPVSCCAYVHISIWNLCLRVHLLGQKTRTCLASVDTDNQVSKTPEPIYTYVRAVSYFANTWYTVFLSLIILVHL